MIINKCAILHFLYNYIDKNKQGVGNWKYVSNNNRPPKIHLVEIIVVLNVISN